VWGILCGGTASLIVLFGLIYLMRVLEPEDRFRLGTVAKMLPKQFATPADTLLDALIRL
jgi:hypothetical protein